MTARLLDLQRALAGLREHLSTLAERLARVRQRERVSLSGVSSAGPAAAAPGLPGGGGGPSVLPFGGADARPIDDVELTFRALEVDVGSDQDKAR